MKPEYLYISLAILLFTACHKKSEEPRVLWEQVASQNSGIDFRNDLSYTEQVNPYTFRNFYNGAGVAIGDINQDGLLDIFFSSNQGSNKLYLNEGDFTFKDMTNSAGLNTEGVWSTGVSMADINQDGLLDIYVCKSGPPGGEKRKNQLFINQGNLTFLDMAQEYGLDEEGLSQHAVFFDYDKDSDLDMYLLSNSGRSVGVFDLRQGQREIRDPEGGNKLFRNDGDYFTDVSEEAGIYGSSIGYGLGVTVADLNDDLWPDLYVSNDFFEKDYLYLNNQDGTFTEAINEILPEISLGSMGADIADLDNDARPEIFVTEMLPADWERIKTKTPFEDWDKHEANLSAGYHNQFTRNTLQRNLGIPPGHKYPVFSEISRLTKMDATDWSWGALIFDADNDGLNDVFVANGIVKDLTDFDFVDYYTDAQEDIAVLKADSVLITKMIDQFPSNPLENYWFRNEGNWNFSNQASSQGLGQLTFSTGSAYGDLDNDGDLDLVVNNQNQEAGIFRNKAVENGIGNYLKVELGDNFGAKVFVYKGEEVLFREFQPVKGYMSSVAPEIHFGLGTTTLIDSMRIVWNDGRESLLRDIPANQTITPKKEEAALPSGKSEEPKPLLSGKPSGIQHSENDFIDFDRDRLRFWMISNEGPKVSQADVNQDGKPDLFIPGSKGNESLIYLQNEVGYEELSFESEEFAQNEDVFGHFLDANGDEFADLYIASGGVEYGNNTPRYKDRLYLGAGSEKFKLSSNSFGFGSSSFVLDYDLDKDGDQDLIIGQRLLPFEYGVPVNLNVYENDGDGNFIKSTDKHLKEINPLGMIREGAISDLDNDGVDELIVIGEWMEIKILSMTQGKWQDKTESLGFAETSGIWQGLRLADVNKDGNMDILAGNWGLNSRLRSEEGNLLSMVINDFDGNGSLDPILSSFSSKGNTPYVLKNSLLKQLPGLRKQLLTYDDYKDKTLEDLFPNEILANSLTLRAQSLATSLWINNGNGSFDQIDLPVETQLSPVFTFELLELEEFKFPLIFFGGNQSKVKPQIGSQLGSYGGVLWTEDGINWEAMSMQESGFFVEGEMRDMTLIQEGGSQKILVFRNNDEALEFTVNR